MTATPDTTTVRSNLAAKFPFLKDPFLDATTDVSTLSTEQREAFCQYFGLRSPSQDDGFGDLRPEVVRGARSEYAQMLNDPSIRAELAERDPKWMAQFKQETIAEIVRQFRVDNPRYRATARNSEAVFSYLTRKYLGGIDWLDSDEAALKLLQAGHLSTQTLKEAYIALRDGGQLRDIPDGEYRALSAEEQIQVIALLRTGRPDTAIERYMQYAMSNSRKSYKTVSEFFAKNPDLCSQASLFVWRHAQVDLSDEEFQQFQKEALAGKQLLTFFFVDDAWKNWKQRHKRSALFPMGSETFYPEPEDPETLSDEELNSRIAQAQRARRRGQEL